MSQRRSFVLASAIFIGLCLCAGPLVAQPAAGGPSLVSFKLGFDGRYKVGYWSPVVVTLRGGKELVVGQLELTVPDADGVPTIVGTPTGRTVTLPPGQDVPVQLYAKVGRASAEIVVRFLVGRDELINESVNVSFQGQHKELDDRDELLVAIGSSSGPRLGPPRPADDYLSAQSETADVPDATLAPTRWYAYDGADAVVLAAGRASAYTQLSADDPRIAALDQWVKMGGCLIVSLGKQSADLLAPGKVLARFAPGQLTGMVTLRRAEEFEQIVNYAGARAPIVPAQPDAAQSATLDAVQFTDIRGHIDLGAGQRASDLPLIVRTAHGLGEVVFVAFDLDQPLLSRWPGRTALMRKLVGREPIAAESDDNALAAAAARNHADATNTLRGGLERFAGVSLVPFWIVALLIMLYVVLIGPGDYLFVKRVLKRMELTWITFPAIVLVFSAGAYFGAYRLKGSQLRLNQVDVVDYDVENSFVRGTTWGAVFSPRHATYTLSLLPDLPKGPLDESQVLFSWLGVPSAREYGMGGSPSGGLLGGSAYRFREGLSAVESMPVAVWSTKAVTARWSGQQAAPLEASLTDEGESRLTGKIVQRTGTALVDCTLYYDRWAFPLGPLDDGESAELRRGANSQTIVSYQEDRRRTPDAPFPGLDADSSSLLATLGHMTLAPFGKSPDSTGVANRYQQFTDIGGQLRCGRAVLVGFARQSASKLMRDDEPLESQDTLHWTMFRFVIPVQQGASSD